MLTQLNLYSTKLDTFYAMLGSQNADLLERALARIQPLIRYQFDEGTGEIEYTNKLCRAYLYEMIYNGKVWDGAIGHVGNNNPYGANVPIKLDALYITNRGIYSFWADVSIFALLSQGFWLKVDVFQNFHDVLGVFMYLQERGEVTTEMQQLWSYVASGRKFTDSETETHHHDSRNYGYFRNAEIHSIIRLLEPYVDEQRAGEDSQFQQLATEFYQNLQKVSAYDVVFHLLVKV